MQIHRGTHRQWSFDDKKPGNQNFHNQNAMNMSEFVNIKVVFFFARRWFAERSPTQQIDWAQAA